MRTRASISIAFARAWPADMPRWARAISAICSPTVSAGLTAAAGSWCTIVMRTPHTRRISARVSASRFAPSSVTTPPVIRPFSGR